MIASADFVDRGRTGFEVSCRAPDGIEKRLVPAGHGRPSAHFLRKDVAARVAGSARRLVLHLPEHWPWEPGLDELFRRALHDPLSADTT